MGRSSIINLRVDMVDLINRLSERLQAEVIDRVWTVVGCGAQARMEFVEHTVNLLY